LAKILGRFIAHLLGQAAEFTENLELQFLGHPREFGGAVGRENDLKCIHRIERCRRVVIAGCADFLASKL
jgi:hypothetical protein